jgi:hypothetical protein
MVVSVGAAAWPARVKARVFAWDRWAWFTLAAVTVFLLVAEHDARRLGRNVPDDAVTSMQYAKNLVHGHGLVFNLGERVDGYTNFLWVLVMAPLYAACEALGVAFVPFMTHFGAWLGAACVGLVCLLSRRVLGGVLPVVVAVLFTLSDNAFSTWAVLGLETHLVAFLMLLALLVSCSGGRHRGLKVGFTLLALHLTRPDAALFGVAWVASELLEVVLAWRARDAGFSQRLRDVGLALAVWLPLYAAYFTWHYAYYGAPFPNTYYVKLGGGIDGWARGATYLREFFEQRAWLPVAAVLGLLAVRRATVRVVLLYVPVHLFYVVYVGGDFMPGHRFLVPDLPLLGLLVGAGAAVVGRLAESRAFGRVLRRVGLEGAHISGSAVTLVLICLLALAERGRRTGPIHDAIAGWRDAHIRQQRLLTWLRDVKPPGATFATGLIGHTGFYADVRAIDTCGIIDPVVARKPVKTLGHGLPGHEKVATDAEILAKKPTYIGIWVLATNLWESGYYLDPNVPADSVPGLWVRDPLAERAELVPGTHWGFDAGWHGVLTASGRAFENGPAREREAGQGVVEGAKGGFVNSFHRTLGNEATGKLRSAPFTLSGDVLVFRIAGGDDAKRLHVALEVDGEKKLRATGKRSDMMGRASFDLRPYRGKQGILEIVDESPEPWGYIAVDELAQYRYR